MEYNHFDSHYFEKDYENSYPTDINEICPSLYMSDVFTAEKQSVLTELKITHIVTVSSGI